MKLQRLIQRHDNTMYKDTNPKHKNNMYTTHTTYNYTTEYRHSKRITDRQENAEEGDAEVSTP